MTVAQSSKALGRWASPNTETMVSCPVASPALQSQTIRSNMYLLNHRYNIHVQYISTILHWVESCQLGIQFSSHSSPLNSQRALSRPRQSPRASATSSKSSGSSLPRKRRAMKWCPHWRVSRSVAKLGKVTVPCQTPLSSYKLRVAICGSTVVYYTCI